MASGERYRKTTTSEIISSSYKNILRQIKTTKLKIEETEERVNQLSNDFKSLQVNNFDDKNYNKHLCLPPGMALLIYWLFEQAMQNYSSTNNYFLS